MEWEVAGHPNGTQILKSPMDEGLRQQGHGMSTGSSQEAVAKAEGGGGSRSSSTSRDKDITFESPHGRGPTKSIS